MPDDPKMAQFDLTAHLILSTARDSILQSIKQFGVPNRKGLVKAVLKSIDSALEDNLKGFKQDEL